MGLFERQLTVILAAATFMNFALAQSDLPPVGRSRFDQLVGVNPVPYPLARLLRELNAQLEADPSGLPPLKITLIPLGRSLQRTAAAPDFFHFPRVIVAVDGASKPGFAPLQDRLFIGYQEKSAILEIISYNESAGRFEFQIVRDYKQGATPSVHYARRTLCLTCHQNAAPIFARPLWDETPANPAIAAQLRATGRDFYGVKLSGTDIAYFIDAATDRANLFAVWQQIWREGCGPDEAGARCRRDWFDASLRYTLSGVLPPPEPARFTHLQARWPRLWPRGLPIPNPDIPNRDPFTQLAPITAATANSSDTDTPLGHVPAAVEPLNPRPPLAYWRSADPQRLIAGLASLFNPADIAALDQALSRARTAAPVQITLPCRLTPKRERRIGFVCREGGNSFSGFWDSHPGASANGEVTGLQIGDALGASDIRLRARGLPTPHRIDFSLTRARQHARLSDGRRLTHVRFNLARRNVTLSVHDDYAVMGSVSLNALAARPGAFDSTLWIGWLVQSLAPNAPPLRRMQSRLSPMQAIPDTPRPSHHSASRYDHQCAQCHHTPDAFPPNFLVGDAVRRERQLDHCAERIYYRLRMWRSAETQRAKTPMPPPAVLTARGIDAHAWRESTELDALTEDAAARIRRQHASPEGVMTQDYERLRNCLPPASQ